MIRCGDIKCGDYVIVKSNNIVNHEVGKSKIANLTVGYRDKSEDGAMFICIREVKPMNLFVKKRFNYTTLQYEYNIVIPYNSIRIMSLKTKKVYDVDADWCMGITNLSEYLEAINIEKTITLIREKFLEDDYI